MVAQNGSDGVMNFVTSSAANGAIGYDEYSTRSTRSTRWSRSENAAGYYTLPTQYNVAKSLTQADIDTDRVSDLIQKLDAVYTYSDPRTYPMSSYSYMILPDRLQRSPHDHAQAPDARDFIYYSICTGQRPRWARSATRRCRSTWCRPASARSPLLKTADPKVD